MVDQDRTKSTYALQWNRYRIVRPEEDQATFRNRVGLDPAALAGLRVLDAGCGMGRYLRIASGGGALVVGIDVSEAVLAAREVAGEAENVAVVRGDLLRPPFGPEMFDHIYSLGVLDHTPDPRRAFLALARLLRPGGRIAIWVYARERPIVERVMGAHRRISRSLPVPVVERLSRWLAPVGGLKRRMMGSRWRLVKRAGVALHLLTIGVSMHPDPEVRVCDTLDWYAPRYASHHTLDEVVGWFREAGLVEITNLDEGQVYFHEGQGHGINVAGRRPGAGPSDRT